MLEDGVPQGVSRPCCAHLAKEACVLADSNPEEFEKLCDLALERMVAQASVFVLPDVRPQ